MPNVDRGDALALLRELVRIDSRNPSLVPGAPGERTIARALGEILVAWGFRVSFLEPEPGRVTVVARLGPPGARSLMFNGHTDIVDTVGMVHAPLDAFEHDGKLYGRGSCDMKGGVAAMCAAAVRAAPNLQGELVVACVADEEFASCGTKSLLAAGVRAEAAIVTEPTQLTIGPAHRGFSWFEFEVLGRAAHGSRYDLGVDAIGHASALMLELERYEQTELTKKQHPLLGRASVHASKIAGGAGWSTYPEHCLLTIERRTLPGEKASDVEEEIKGLLARVRAARPTFEGRVQHVLTQMPSDVSVDAPIVGAMRRALGACNLEATVRGVTAWTDAALLNDAGIPAICFGPGDMGLAHAAEEYVPTADVERAAQVLAHLACAWTQGAAA